MKLLNRINSIRVLHSYENYRLYEVGFPIRYYITFCSYVKYRYNYEKSALKKYYSFVHELIDSGSKKEDSDEL